MRKFMIFGLIGIVVVVAAAADYYPEGYQEGYTYSGESPEFSQQAEEVPVAAPLPETEYFTFTAPDDFNDSKDVQRLGGIVRPQRVVFIRTPEKNIFSITAEQLAKKDSLNIFLLSRQTNSEGLLTQLEEIRQRVGQKPNVQFVKYRTAEDIDRAKQAIYNDFESLPGPSQYHEDAETPVYEFNSKSQHLQERSGDVVAPSDPVIFKIIRHSPAIGAEQTTTTDQGDAQQYLPPSSVE